MGMSEFYGDTDEPEAIATIHRAIELGVTFLDTADVYGRGRNEELVGKAIKDCRGDVVLATKFGNVRAADGTFVGVNGQPNYVRSACEASLLRLKVDVIELYYQHRVDPDTPIEDTVGAMAELVDAGKVRTLACPRPRPTRSGARTRCIQSPHCRPNIHSGAASQRESCWTRCASSGSASFPIVRSAAGS